LFHVLLTHCLDLKDPRKLEQCWLLMPHNFGVFDLLRLTRLAENRGKKKPSPSSGFSTGLSSTSTGSLSAATPSSSTSQLPSYSSIFVKAGQEDEDEKDEDWDDKEDYGALGDPLDEEDEEEDEPEEEENEFSVAHFRPQLLSMFKKMKLTETST